MHAFMSIRYIDTNVYALTLSQDEELQNEKCVALRRVDEDMRSLQRIYTDLATAAEDQQASLEQRGAL